MVDTHVGRLARRFGRTSNEDPVKVERDLMRLVSQKDWLDLSHMLIYHGHAIRWIFIGLIACWLLWRHMKYRRLRWLLMALALAMAISGGFAQFYTGFHLASDLTGGYLFGASIACCAIGLLLLNERPSAHSRVTPS